MPRYTLKGRSSIFVMVEIKVDGLVVEADSEEELEQKLFEEVDPYHFNLLCRKVDYSKLLKGDGTLDFDEKPTDDELALKAEEEKLELGVEWSELHDSD